MEHNATLRSMIHAVKHDQLELELPIFNKTGEKTGRMVPLTIHDIKTESLIAEFVAWRNRDRTGWLDQRNVNLNGTRKWMENLIADDHRMAFLVLNQNNDIIGRIGFLDLTSNSAMVDSIIRGRPDLSPGIMTSAFIAMTRWLFQNSTIDILRSQVIQGNDPSMKIHHALGFQLQEAVTLASTVTDDGSHILSPTQTTSAHDAHGQKILNRLSLTRADFMLIPSGH